MNENYFMGLDGFVWFTGVVENRNDPAKLGRVQVRCLGYHTEDLNEIPSADLPWAHVMHPVTDPSMQGLGNSPSFLTEGTWVVGFFRDANEKQQPVIMGSLPGVPASAADKRKGFNDPNGKYPGTISHSGHTTGESDVSRLARGSDAENHDSLITRRGFREELIDTATKPHLSNVSTQSSAEKRSTFNEPHPRGVADTGTATGQYPFNHVHESESGHIQEIDDTPGGERLHREHKSGTYEEIVADGTKTVKVVGSNYELIAGSSNIYIQGDVNLTIDGTKREFIKGDYILEVLGDYTRKIHKNEQVKIGAGGAGNLEEEIIGNHGFNINNSVIGSVGSVTDDNKNYILTIGGNQATSVGGALAYQVQDRVMLKSSDVIMMHANKRVALVSVNNVDISAGTSMYISAASAMDIKSEAVGTMTFLGDGSVINLSGDGSTVTATNSSSTAIELTAHIHTDTAGLGANATTAPIS